MHNCSNACKNLQKPLPETLTILIDWAVINPLENTVHLPEPMSIDQWPNINLSRDSLYGN